MGSHPFQVCSCRMDFILIDTQDFLDKGVGTFHMCVLALEKRPQFKPFLFLAYLLFQVS